MSFADGNLIPLDKQIVLADIVDLGNIYDIRAVYFNEALAVHLFFQVLDGVMRNELLVAGHELDVIAHTFYIQDIVIVQPHQLTLAFDENVVSSHTCYIIVNG